MENNNQKKLEACKRIAELLMNMELSKEIAIALNTLKSMVADYESLQNKMSKFEEDYMNYVPLDLII